ncbi:MAG: hypothetical protein SNJ60_06780 [Pseudanabaenaceae cyanobacterium]
MKCINCGTDNRLKDRTEHQGKCKNCGTPFAFEPTAMPFDRRFTDGAFLKILNDVSANGTLYFTKQQLFYAIAKRIHKVQIQGWSLLLFLILLAFSAIPVIAVASSFSVFPSFLLVYTTMWFLRLWFVSQNLALFRRERLQRAKGLVRLGVVSLVEGCLCLYFSRQSGLALLLVLLGLNSIGLGLWQQRRIPKTPEASLSITPQFVEQLLEQWIQAHGLPEKLLLPPLASDVFAPPGDEVTNYSFDRLIVCQSDDIAKLLIANNVPFEYNSGVVSLQGYPQGLFETILTMAKRNPKLGIYVLHDCSAEGVATLYTVKNDPHWFGGQDYLLVDVGLSPRQILTAKKPVWVLSSTDAMRSALQLGSEIRRTLPPQELQWLDEGNYALLAFLSPQKIIQALYRSLFLGATMGTFEDRDTPLMAVGDSDVYGLESFG